MNPAKKEFEEAGRRLANNDKTESHLHPIGGGERLGWYWFVLFM